MALPTITEFRTRFPEFSDTSDPTIELAISDAGQFVDESWLAGDYAPAILFLAAHYLSAGAAQAEQTTDGGGPPIKAESIGRISTTYGDAPKSSDWASTGYGSRFMDFFNRNRKRVIVV